MVERISTRRFQFDRTHIAVIGDGVIGLLTTLELLKRNCQVTLLGQGFGEGQASWASGGILSPLCPWQAQSGVQALWAWSCRLYPDLRDELLAATGMDIELVQNGMLLLDAADQDRMASWVDGDVRRCLTQDCEQVRQQIPLLDTLYEQAHFLPQVSQLRPLRLMTALMGYLQQFPHFQMKVPLQLQHLTERPSGEVLLDVAGTPLCVDQVVVCAGAWTNRVLSPLGVELSIIPVKGQMLLLDGEGIELGCIVMKHRQYLVPRLDGGILVGSTLEEGVDDVQVTEAAGELLHAAACDLIPALAERRVRHQWAGVRPGSVDGVPYIGRLAGYQSVWVNAGHYRNGINMAPGSARLIAQLIHHETTTLDPQPYWRDGIAGC